MISGWWIVIRWFGAIPTCSLLVERCCGRRYGRTLYPLRPHTRCSGAGKLVVKWIVVRRLAWNRQFRHSIDWPAYRVCYCRRAGQSDPPLRQQTNHSIAVFPYGNTLRKNGKLSVSCVGMAHEGHPSPGRPAGHSFSRICQWGKFAPGRAVHAEPPLRQQTNQSIAVFRRGLP